MNFEGNRKLIVAVVMLALCLGIVVVKGDVPSGLVQVLEFLFPAFVAGNAVEHITKAYASSSDTPVGPAVASQDVAQLHASVEGLHATSADIQQGVTTMNQAMAMLIQRNQEYLQAQQDRAAANRAAAKAPYAP